MTRKSEKEHPRIYDHPQHLLNILSYRHEMAFRIVAQDARMEGGGGHSDRP